jgi:GntR family transcriptional regulator
VPLHAQVAQSLRQRLESRDLRPGDLFPTEAVLQQEFSVSRSVVRQALASLEADGLIHKVQGRGSVVTDHQRVHRDVLSPGLTLRPGHDGAIRTHVTSYTLVPRPDHLQAITGEQVLELERLRSVDGEVLSFIRTWLPADVAELISADALEDASLHQLLAERLGRQVAGGQNQIRAVAATSQLAERLGVVEGAPLLLLEGRSVDRHGVTLEEFSTWHRGDQAAFDVEAMPPSVRDDVPADRDRIERLAGTVQDVLAELEQLRRRHS